MTDRVQLLRAALARISHLRRDKFSSGFQYELAVRHQADDALHHDTTENADTDNSQNSTDKNPHVSSR